MSVEAYPLQWPAGRPRTDHWRRERSAFEVTLARARDDIIREVQLLVGKYNSPHTVISSNLALRNDGLPLARQPRTADDPGVAVYFTRKGKQLSFACDRWTKVEDNMRAIAKTIEALRGIDRWGTGDMLEAAFTGFVALPAPGAQKEWWEVLGVARLATAEECRHAYRRLAALHHPDRGGDATLMAQINAAYEKAPKQ
jgi:hypothetical protein